MSELISQYFEKDINLEDMKLLVTVIEKDAAAAENFSRLAADQWSGWQRGVPEWPASRQAPSLGRKGMSLLYLFSGLVILFFVLFGLMAWKLSPKKITPAWQLSARVQSVDAERYKALPEEKPQRPDKPQGPERTQQGPVIEVHQSVAGDVIIDISMLDGKEVRKGLYSGKLEAGVWKFNWDGLDRYSRKVKPGIFRVSITRPHRRPRTFMMRLTKEHLKKM